jgi:hypothetical protein
MPLVDSSSANDVHIIAMQGSIQVGEDDMTIVAVRFGTTQNVNSLDIRNNDTPTSMLQDRIPPTSVPSAVTPVYVTVSPNLAGSGQSINLSITGQSNNNGMVNINGKNMINITSSGSIELEGIDQTDISGSVDANGKIVGNIGLNAGNLLLTVDAHGVTALQSHGFSVAAIPIGYVETFKSPIDSTHPDPRNTCNHKYNTRGFDVTVVPISDSGSSSDLGGIYISEQVQYVDSKLKGGVFNEVASENSTYLSAIPDPGNIRGDVHSVDATVVKAPGGTEYVFQTHIFLDLRTGAYDIPVSNSGYVLARKVSQLGTGWIITTTEVGAATTANSYGSSAGTLNGNQGSMIVTIAEP